MKTLFLVRHAKSDWSMESQKDIDRSLNPRGYNDAHRMGKLLSETFGQPQAIISSSAIRTVSTALIFCDEMNFPKDKIQINQHLYESSMGDYLQCIKEIDNRFNSAMIIGHNPVLSELCMSFTRTIIDLPTCAVVVFESKCENWSDISRTNTALKEVKTPKSED